MRAGCLQVQIFLQTSDNTKIFFDYTLTIYIAHYVHCIARKKIQIMGQYVSLMDIYNLIQDSVQKEQRFQFINYQQQIFFVNKK